MHVLKSTAAPCAVAGTVPKPIARHGARAVRPVPSVKETRQVLRPFSASSAAPRLSRRALRPACTAQAPAPTHEAQVREEQAGPCRTRLHITVPASAVAAVYRQTVNEFRKGVKVPGFRKGKAPDAAVINEVGGQQRFNRTVVASLLEVAMKQAMAPYEARAIDESEVVDQEGEELAAALDPQADFTFSVSFDSMPELRWKRPYREITVEVEMAGDDISDAAAVESKLQDLRREGARLRVVATRGMQKGDVVIMDIDIAHPESGESLIGGVREGFQTDTTTSDATFIPGVADAMVGMRVGETRSATLTLPTADSFQPASLRGQTAAINVTLKELFEYDLPEVDDAWAESVSPGCGGLAGLRTNMLEAQKQETDAKTHKAIEDALIDAVANAVDCPVPESLVLQLGQQMYQVKLQEAVADGKLTMEVVRQLATEQLLMEYIKKERESLERTQRGLMAVAEILRQEKLTATLAEIQAEFQAAVRGFEQFGQEYDKERLMEQVQQQIEGRKAMDWMLANLGVNVLPYTGGAKQ